jgi:hypothetical protein
MVHNLSLSFNIIGDIKHGEWVAWGIWHICPMGIDVLVIRSEGNNQLEDLSLYWRN